MGKTWPTIVCYIHDHDVTFDGKLRSNYVAGSRVQ